jgi:hypothetical protein
MRALRIILGSYTVATIIVLGFVLHKPHHTVRGPTIRPSITKLNPVAIDHAKDFTVLISNEGFAGVERGTGVLLNPNYVLTCLHLVPPEEDGQEMWVYHRVIPQAGIPMFVRKGKCVFSSRKDDLALIKLDGPMPSLYYATFTTKFTVGEPLVIMGF